MGKGEEKENTSVNINSIYDIVAKVASSERGVFFQWGTISWNAAQFSILQDYVCLLG